MATLTLNDVIKEHVLKILKEVENNKLKAANVLGIGRSTLYRYLKSWGQTKG